ncbi:hypothetical protein MLD38_015134 [Melastoma candidum]|uniref:Uncharacterized protein n=1 Tax=Melastoma candidum TaxID=119954 RepID=A0ACB9RNK0_9MYRT|nr:hypothetical protein MLD38_015134 [Melastoma candidum]
MLQRILQTEGFPGFYKGHGASVLRIVPYAALHFMTYERVPMVDFEQLSKLGFRDVNRSYSRALLPEGTAVMCTYPLDLARTKTCLSRGNSGIVPRCWSDSDWILPYAGLKFYIYEELKESNPFKTQRWNHLREVQEHMGRTHEHSPQPRMEAAVCWLSINYIKIVPSVAIGFTVYDSMKVWLEIPPRQKAPSPASA